MIYSNSLRLAAGLFSNQQASHTEICPLAPLKAEDAPFVMSYNLPDSAQTSLATSGLNSSGLGSTSLSNTDLFTATDTNPPADTGNPVSDTLIMLGLGSLLLSFGMALGSLAGLLGFGADTTGTNNGSACTDGTEDTDGTESTTDNSAALQKQIETLRQLTKGDAKISEEELTARAQFDVSGQNGGEYDLNTLDKYLVHRRLNNLPGAQKQQLDKQVLDLAKKLDVKFTSDRMKDLESDKATRNNEGTLTEADFASKVIIASSIVAENRNRPDLLDKLLKQDGQNLQILISSNSGDSPAAGISASENRIMLRNDYLGPYAVTHEVAHKIDSIDQKGNVDGILYNMSAEGQKTMAEERQRLRDIFKETGKAPAGLSDYGFKDLEGNTNNNAEFTAEMVRLFNEDPKSLNQGSSKIYDTLKDYYKTDPLHELSGGTTGM